ncbi:hypothetical protein WKK05_07215 [Nostoc sp. UHCC 0302]|uniref:hypothetical protein n=1 Tax=Nostoc sp. UHCC 0302 TaxID=3134896 RepID=UPI00311CD88E
MNLKLLPLSLFTLASVSSFIPAFTPSAKAACVLADVGVQVAIHGRNSTANQSNNVNQQAADDCFGNAVTTTGTQVYTGSGSVQQTRNSNQYVVGGNNPTGVKIPTIKIPVGVQVNIESPAYDPNFLPRR